MQDIGEIVWDDYDQEQPTFNRRLRDRSRIHNANGCSAIHYAGVPRSRDLCGGGGTRSDMMLVLLTWVVVPSPQEYIRVSDSNQ